jgi:hypothetical protein
LRLRPSSAKGLALYAPVTGAFRRVPKSREMYVFPDLGNPTIITCFLLGKLILDIVSFRDTTKLYCYVYYIEM